MAPSEFDLRAALAEGEGEGGGLNANLLIHAGRARRAQRRSRFLTTAAVVVLVAGGAVGISQLGGGGESNADSAAVGGNALERGSGTSRTQYDASGGVNAGGLSSPSAPAAAKERVAHIGCPTITTAYSLVQDAGQATGSAARAPLFQSTVSAAVVCAYGSTLQPAIAPASRPGRLELVGTSARRLAASMDSAGQSPNPGPCGQGIANRFTVTAIAGSGQVQDPVTVDLVGAACAPVLTNGSAVRYDWVPPPDLARRISELAPTGMPDSPNPSPTN